MCVKHRFAPALVHGEDVGKGVWSCCSPSPESGPCHSRKSSWAHPLFTEKRRESSVRGRKTQQTWAFLSFPGKWKLLGEHLSGSRPGVLGIAAMAGSAGILILGQAPVSTPACSIRVAKPIPAGSSCALLPKGAPKWVFQGDVLAGGEEVALHSKCFSLDVKVGKR